MTKELARIKDYFDFSNLPTDHELYSTENAREPGRMKLEFPDKILTLFCGLRAKCYCVESLEGDRVKKAKGVSRSVVQKEISIQDYLDCLKNNSTLSLPQHHIRSKALQLFTVVQDKVSLSTDDDKRYQIPNTFDTLAWGHYKIPPQ